MKPNLKPRHIVLGALLAATVAAALYDNGQPTDVAGVVGAAERAPGATPAARSTATQGDDKAATTAATTTRPAPAAREPEVALVLDRAALIGGKSGSDGGTATPLFASHSWTPPPPPPPPVVAAPPPKPTAPPLPFTYLGKMEDNGKWEAYLTRNGETYVVREQSVIDGTYRADSITPSMLTMTYLPLKQVQRLAIGGE